MAVPLHVASHNVMHGVRLGGLLPQYAALRDSIGLDVLCVQEHEHGGVCFGQRISGVLGASYRSEWHPDYPRLGLVYDAARLRLVEAALMPLPRLARLAWHERFYIAGGKTRQKYVQLVRFRARAAGGASGRGASGLGDATARASSIPATPEIAVANVHLDTAGGNAHRGAQFAAVVEALRARGWLDHFVICGDTNAFALGRRRQARALTRLLAPARAAGASAPGSAATHFFGRQRESRLSHRLCVAAGRLGIDLPLRYDVVASNLPVVRHGQVCTPDSDHDLVWAALAWAGE